MMNYRLIESCIDLEILKEIKDFLLNVELLCWAINDTNRTSINIYFDFMNAFFLNKSLSILPHSPDAGGAVGAAVVGAAVGACVVGSSPPQAEESSF